MVRWGVVLLAQLLHDLTPVEWCPGWMQVDANVHPARQRALQGAVRVTVQMESPMMGSVPDLQRVVTQLKAIPSKLQGRQVTLRGPRQACHGLAVVITAHQVLVASIQVEEDVARLRLLVETEVAQEVHGVLLADASIPLAHQPFVHLFDVSEGAIGVLDDV